MLRILIVLIAVGAVLYALAALSPQTGQSVAMPSEMAKPLAALKSRWTEAKAAQEVVSEPTPEPIDAPPSEVMDEAMPPQAAAVSVPETPQQPSPPVRDVLQQTQAAVSTPARHKDQYTERDVLAVNRDSVKIFSRIEQLFNEHEGR